MRTPVAVTAADRLLSCIVERAMWIHDASPKLRRGGRLAAAETIQLIIDAYEHDSYARPQGCTATIAAAATYF